MSSDPNAPVAASYELQLRDRQRRIEWQRRQQQQLQQQLQQQWQPPQVQNPTNQQTLNTLTTHNIHNTRNDHRRDYYYDNRYRQNYINSDNNTNRQYHNYGRHYQSDNGVVNVFDHPPQPPAQMPPPPQQIPANRPPPPQAAPQPAGPFPGPPPRPAAANGGVPRVAAVAAVAPVAPVAPARLGGRGPDIAAPPVLGQFYVPPLEPVAQGQVGTGQFYAQYSAAPRAGGGGFGGFGGTGSVGVKQEYGYSAHGHYNDQKLRQRVANGFENALNTQDIMMPPAAVKQEKQEMKVFDLVADEEDEETESEDNGMGIIAPNMKPNKALDGLDSAMGGSYDVSTTDYQGNGSNQTFADSNMQPPNQLQGFGGGAAAGAMSHSGQQEGAGLSSVKGGPGAVHEDLEMFSDTNKGKNQYNVTPPTAMVGGEGVGRLGKQLNKYNGGSIEYDYGGSLENTMYVANGRGSVGMSLNTPNTFDNYGNVKNNANSRFGGDGSAQTQ